MIDMSLHTEFGFLECERAKVSRVVPVESYVSLGRNSWQEVLTGSLGGLFCRLCWPLSQRSQNAVLAKGFSRIFKQSKYLGQ